MAILYVAADKMELQPFASRLEGLRSLKWPLDYATEGLLDGNRIILVANGAGPKLAEHATEIAIRALTAAHLGASRVTAIVSTGFCGGLDGTLRENGIVLGQELLTCDGTKIACEMAYAAPEPFSTGTVFSQDRIACTAAEKSQLFSTGAIAIEMEAAGVAARASRVGVPFFCIKVVSDRADESFAFDLNTMRTREGRIARGKIVGYAVAHPKHLAGLVRLKRRGDAAAKALGEFLVSSRILPDSSNGSIE